MRSMMREEPHDIVALSGPPASFRGRRLVVYQISLVHGSSPRRPNSILQAKKQGCYNVRYYNDYFKHACLEDLPQWIVSITVVLVL